MISAEEENRQREQLHVLKQIRDVLVEIKDLLDSGLPAADGGE